MTASVAKMPASKGRNIQDQITTSDLLILTISIGVRLTCNKLNTMKKWRECAMVLTRVVAGGKRFDTVPESRTSATFPHAGSRYAPPPAAPVFSSGMTLINANLGFMREGATLTYFYGHLPVFRHEIDDQRSFRMITSQFYVNGSATQSEICQAFGVSAISGFVRIRLMKTKTHGLSVKSFVQPNALF